MRSKLLSGDELVGLRQLNVEAENLEENARNLIRGLDKEFSGDAASAEFPRLLFRHAPDNRVIGTVNCKFGKGRFVLIYRTEGQTVKAQMIVERAVQDERDREIWEPVMAIPLPAPDWTMDGQPLRKPSDKAFMLGASVLHAIINGPSTAE